MGISLLTPALIGGAALVVVPVVLHMIMRRKPVRREFPAIRFLRELERSNRRRLRVNNLLLLLVRMAAIIGLAFAMARPTLRGAGWLADQEGPVAAAFVFDTSPRMLVRKAGRTRIEEAVALAGVLQEKLPPQSDLAVLDTGGGPAAFAPSPAAAAEAVRRLAAARPLAAPAVRLAEAVRRAVELLADSERGRRELTVFTDLSAAAWADSEPLAEIVRDRPGLSVLVVDVGAESPRNLAIDAIDLAGERIAAGTPLWVGTSRSCRGPDASGRIALELLDRDGRYERRAEKPVTWSESGCEPAGLEVTGLEAGVVQGRVVIVGADDFAADDSRSFTIEVSPRPRVLLAAPAPAERTAFFLRQAIAPTTLARAGRGRFDCELVDIAAIGEADWAGLAGIVLLDPPALADRTWKLLEGFVAGGGGLVVWLGPGVGDPASFNSPAARRLLGGGLERVWRDPSGGNYLSPDRLDHPMLAAFRRVADAVPWEDYPVERHWEFVPGPEAPPQSPDGGPAEPDGDGRRSPESAAVAVAAYRNGLPALLEHRIGAGTVVIVTTPVSQTADDPEAWNTLATGFEPWPFVILANESLLYAIRSNQSLNVVAGTPITLSVAGVNRPSAFVSTPGGDEFPAAVHTGRGTIVVTETREPGNYRVRAGGERDGFRGGFSANLDAAATDLTTLDAKAREAILGKDARVARTAEDLVREVNLERVGAELYGWIILLAAAMMVGDWMLANRFHPPKEIDEPAGLDAAEFRLAAQPPPLPAVGVGS
jgi:hypothetical protein